MEMFRILVFPQIRDHATGPMFSHHAGGHLLNHLKQLEQQLAILFAEGEQRVDMMFGNYDDVNRVKRASVVKGKHILSFHNSPDSSASTQDFVAIEVIHCAQSSPG